MVLTLMGLGGLVATNYTSEVRQQVERERYLHNERVLEEAKQILLYYAYDYPNLNPDRGPGRLPCPDLDNNGLPGVGPAPLPPPVADCGSVVGRFPWAANGIDLPGPLLDADGEELWYAVSSSFDYADDDVINPDSFGTITIFDQGNRRLYDGGIADPGYGIAAVIIAPGAETDRAGVPQNRNAGPNNPINYLDFFAGRDNTDFVNGDSDNGFVLGPISVPNGNVIINDQLALVSARDVIDMARRATLEIYRQQIDAWQVAVGANVYPWLNDYDDINDLDVYHVVPQPPDNAGRVPYLNYYTDRDSHTVITDLVVEYDFNFGLEDTNDPFGGTYLTAPFDTAFGGTRQIDITDANIRFSQQVIDGGADNITDFRGTMIVEDDGANTALNSAATVTVRRFFWDGCASCFEGSDGWDICPDGGNTVDDCAFDEDPPYASEDFSGDWDDHADIRIRVVDITLTVDPEFEIGLLTTAVAPGAITAPTAGDSAERTYNLIAGVDTANYLKVDVDGTIAPELDFVELSVTLCEQDDQVFSNFNTFYLGNDDSGTSLCNIALSEATVRNQLEATADYFPELPVWVSVDGWNDAVLMAFALDHAPGGAGNCVGAGNCLTVNNEFDGNTIRNVALLVVADELPANAVGLTSIFTGENDAPGEDLGGGLDNIYDANPGAAEVPANGNNTLLVLEEL